MNFHNSVWKSETFIAFVVKNSEFETNGKLVRVFIECASILTPYQPTQSIRHHRLRVRNESQMNKFCDHL